MRIENRLTSRPEIQHTNGKVTAFVISNSSLERVVARLAILDTNHIAQSVAALTPNHFEGGFRRGGFVIEFTPGVTVEQITSLLETL